jgi:hypothetical protein
VRILVGPSSADIRQQKTIRVSAPR